MVPPFCCPPKETDLDLEKACGACEAALQESSGPSHARTLTKSSAVSDAYVRVEDPEDKASW